MKRFSTPQRPVPGVFHKRSFNEQPEGGLFAMLIGYARVSKSDGTQDEALQLDALKAAGVEDKHIYLDQLTGTRDDRPALDACLKALRDGDTLVVWKLDRLGRSM